jgi:hypothetical protein
VYQVGRLLVVCSAVWVAAAYPAFLLRGEMGLVHSAVAAVVCLVPAGATLLLAKLGSPDQRALLILGGSGIRMFVVLGVVLLLNLTTSYFQPIGFALWVLVFYLVTLAMEVALLVQEQSGLQTADQPQP